MNIDLKDAKTLASVRLLLLDGLPPEKVASRISNPWIAQALHEAALTVPEPVAHRAGPNLYAILYDDLLTEYTIRKVTYAKGDTTPKRYRTTQPFQVIDGDGRRVSAHARLREAVSSLSACLWTPYLLAKVEQAKERQEAAMAALDAQPGLLARLKQQEAEIRRLRAALTPLANATILEP
ncbi:hypothetical protein [Streptomyces albidoflavus]|uniref:hypothetical protein n=1 Tax=Streptomyces albidoflavus TaxID=1886 RepID=UPI0034062C26